MTPKLMAISPKMLLAAAAALAIAVGFLLPGQHSDEAQAQPQIPMQVIGES